MTEFTEPSVCFALKVESRKQASIGTSKSSLLPSTPTTTTFVATSATLVICRSWTGVIDENDCNGKRTMMSMFGRSRTASMAEEPVSPEVPTSRVSRCWRFRSR